MALACIKFTRKRLKIEAIQRNKELCIDWQDSLQNFSAKQLVFINESGSDEHTSNHSYGWARREKSTRVSRWFRSREQISVLLAYTTKGYITAMTFASIYTGELFEEFIINYLLSLCNPYS